MNAKREASHRDASRCISCRRSFGLLRWRHKCPKCERPFCSNCLTGKVQGSSRLKVCSGCETELNRCPEPEVSVDSEGSFVNIHLTRPEITWGQSQDPSSAVMGVPILGGTILLAIPVLDGFPLLPDCSPFTGEPTDLTKLPDTPPLRRKMLAVVTLLSTKIKQGDYGRWCYLSPFPDAVRGPLPTTTHIGFHGFGDTYSRQGCACLNVLHEVFHQTPTTRRKTTSTTDASAPCSIILSCTRCTNRSDD